ncbi:GNAT family N-acetyltransferase [Nocardioides cynanchi]|uniref:GNAT family N-acetyltransferase n=1 Tax=Nocardioides cynanchi TaxID=2558918 RepID=UPI00124469D7|nr:GNAT family N-acetyltransferase [Nocardioides cynanchi]
MPDVPTAPTLTDGTVTLRAHREDDVPGVVEQATDPASVRWTTVPTPYGVDEAHAFVTEVMPGGWAAGRWGFAVESEGRYAGTVELRDEGGGRAEIAFASTPWVRGTGAMQRACRLVLDWGFSERGVRTVVWHAHVGNWTSRRLAWRLGFSFDGTLRGYLRHRGNLVDAWSGTLLVTDERGPRSTWLETPLLTDEVVRLRPLRYGDLARVVEAAGDDRTQRWLGRMPSPYTWADARTWLEQTLESAASGDAVTWAVTGDDDVLLAAVNLFDIAPGNAAEVGFWAHPDARGRGVTTRATALALRHGFDALGLVRIEGHAALGNAASRHALEAAGLREAGVVRLGTVIRPEGRVDAMRYDVLVEEWRGSR